MKGTRFVWWLLLSLGMLAGQALCADEPGPVQVDEQILTAARLQTDGPSLLRFFRDRSLTENEQIKIGALIQRLGSNSFREREQAMTALIQRGPVIIELLRPALTNTDLEIASRAERCLQRIRENDFPPHVPAAAARLVRERKPAGAVEVLLTYLPFADNENVADEVRTTLAALALHNGKADPALLQALKSRTPVVRAAAGEALIRAAANRYKDEVRPLLKDSEPLVKLRVAMALASTGERSAVPVIIDLLPQLAQVQAWQAEDVLLRLTSKDNPPPQVSLGKSAEERKRAQAAWSDWWQAHAKTVNLAQLKDRPKMRGHTIVLLLDAGKALELGQNNQVRWEVDDLGFPLDIQIVEENGGVHLLAAEYHASRVSIRDLTGKITWQKPVVGPLVAQRLANHNTFIATDSELFEIDRNDNRVFTYSFPNGERIMKATKTADGQVVCLTDAARLVWLQSQGGETKEVKAFPLQLGKRLFGGRLYLTPTGGVLVPHNAENKVAEYGPDGKEVWKVEIEEPIAAVRLPNGNTLVTTMNQNRAVEFDRAGQEVWEYRTNTRVTRALRH